MWWTSRSIIAAATTGTLIMSRAHVARNTFYDLFESRDESRRFAFDQAHARLFGPIEAAVEMDGAWLTRLSLGIGNLLTITQEEPLVAELCLVHSWGGARGGGGLRLRGGHRSARRADRGWKGRGLGGRQPPLRSEPGPRVPPRQRRHIAVGPSTEERRSEEPASLHLILGDLVALVAGPFIGLEEARATGRELEGIA